MNCLLVAATSNEIAPFIKWYSQHASQFNRFTVDILISGVGMTATTHSLTRQVQLKRPDLVIQAGIAGCFDKNISQTTVFVVKKDTIADLGVIEKNKLVTVFDMGLVKGNQFPYSQRWLVNKSWLLSKMPWKKVNAISVNRVTTQAGEIKLYRELFNPVLETMEGAALHYTCLAEHIPFIQLRAVSNYIGERNKKHWKIKESINELNLELIRLLETI